MIKTPAPSFADAAEPLIFLYVPSRWKAMAPCPWLALCLLLGAAYLCVLKSTEHPSLVAALG